MSQSGGTPTPSDFLSGEAQNRDRDFAEVPDNLWSDVQGSPGFRARFNEENIFREQYFEAAQVYTDAATNVNAQGRVIPNLFLRWADVVAEFTRYVLRGDADDALDAVLSWDPEGAGEAMIRPFRTDSFANAQYTQTPGSTGQFNIIPDDTQANDSTETATANEQAWIIIGWYEPVAGNVVPYDYVQANVNDNIGVRREEFLKYQMESKGTTKWAPRERGPLMIPPGFTLDVDVNVVQTGIETGLWPVGIEVIRADASEFGGVLG